MSVDAYIYIVDDDPILLRSLTAVLKRDNYVIRTFSSADEFLEAYEPISPGCILLDVLMPTMNGLDVQKKLAERPVSHPVIMMSGKADVPMAVRALEAGAAGFLEKPIQPEELLNRVVEAIEHDVQSNNARIRRSTLQKLMSLLTPREKEILAMVAEGKLTKQIAGSLDISERTVETHRSHIAKKLNVDSLSAGIRLYVEWKLQQSESN